MAGNKTLLVINGMSGNSEGVKAELIKYVCAKNDEVDEVILTSPEQDYDADGYDKLIVCGGDGTINNAINKVKDRDIDVFYFPCGTLNERAKSKNGDLAYGVKRLRLMGTVNDRLFSYVIAVGAFTDIGYRAKSKTKKKFKALAYCTKILSSYKVHKIGAEVVTDKYTFVGEYNLIMVIDSNRCFGFNFNRAYDARKKTMGLLLIKTTGKNNFFGKIRMFFPFFRAFFIGFDKDYRSRNIEFTETEKVEMILDGEYDFDVDGEHRKYGGFLHVEKIDLKPRLFIMRR